MDNTKPDRMGPWIAIYTKIVDSDALQSLTFAERSVFLQTFFMAARLEHDCIYGGRTYHLQPGQFVYTRADLIQRCGRGCSDKVVRQTIDKLIENATWANERADERANGPSLITFINWSMYQRPYGQRANERANERAGRGPTEGTQTQSGTDGFLSNKVVTRFKEEKREEEERKALFSQPKEQPAQKKEPDQEPKRTPKHAKIDDVWQANQARPEPGPEPEPVVRLVRSYIPKANHETLGQLHKRLIAAAGSCKGCRFNGGYEEGGHCTAQAIWDKDNWRAIFPGIPASCLKTMMAPAGTRGKV